MNPSLPTANDLEYLPLRAMVAYAARNARRRAAELRGIVADDLLDHALNLVDNVATTSLIDEIDKSAIMRAVEHVTAAYAAAPGQIKSIEKFLAVFPMVHAAETAVLALMAATSSGDAPFQMDCVAGAAEEAERTVRFLKALGSEGASAARDAALRDYQTLLREYGRHEEVTIGKPVHCFHYE